MQDNTRRITRLVMVAVGAGLVGSTEGLFKETDWTTRVWVIAGLKFITLVVLSASASLSEPPGSVATKP